MTQMTHDTGNEFIGKAFQKMMRKDCRVKGKPITVRNLQANAIVERVHQTIGNMVRTFELKENYLDEDDPWKGILCATAFAVRATVHTTLQKTPAQSVFGRDMILNVNHVENWEHIKQRQQALANKNDKRENSKRLPCKHEEGDSVLVKRGTETKHESPHEGPCSVLKICDDRTIWAQRGAVACTANIKKITPFVEPDVSSHGGNATGKLQQEEVQGFPTKLK